jgi:hypothetical protein
MSKTKQNPHFMPVSIRLYLSTLLLLSSCAVFKPADQPAAGFKTWRIWLEVFRGDDEGGLYAALGDAGITGSYHLTAAPSGLELQPEQVTLTIRTSNDTSAGQIVTRLEAAGLRVKPSSSKPIKQINHDHHYR